MHTHLEILLLYGSNDLTNDLTIRVYIIADLYFKPDIKIIGMRTGQWDF